MRWQAVIFDLDGTLVDTLADLADSLNRVLAEQGFPVHEAPWYRTAVGGGLRELVSKALPITQRGPDEIERVRQLMLSEYGTHCLDATRPYAGVPELLGDLVERGIPAAVNSNKPHALAQLIVDALLEPAAHFRAVVGAQPGVPLKPDPAAALSIAEQIGVPPSEIAYVGDSAIDMLTARAAGMVPIGVSWGFRGRGELSRHGAHAVIDHPRELLPSTR